MQPHLNEVIRYRTSCSSLSPRDSMQTRHKPPAGSRPLFDWSDQNAIHTYWQRGDWLACRHSAAGAPVHVRWRPLYCKQLRASLLALSGWALAYISPSPQRNLCGRQRWSGHCLFRESLSVSPTFFFLSMHASFLSPLPIYRGPFLLSSAVPLSGPYWEDRDRHSAPPKVCLPVWSALVLNKSAQTLPTHSNPPQKHVHKRVPNSPHSSPFSVISYLHALVPTAFLWHLFVMHSRCSVKLSRFKSRITADGWSRSDETPSFDLYQIFLCATMHHGCMSNRQGWKCCFPSGKNSGNFVRINVIKDKSMMRFCCTNCCHRNSYWFNLLSSAKMWNHRHIRLCVVFPVLWLQQVKVLRLTVRSNSINTSSKRPIVVSIRVKQVIIVCKIYSRWQNEQSAKFIKRNCLILQYQKFPKR